MTDAKTAPKKPLERVQCIDTFPNHYWNSVVFFNSPAVEKYEQKAVTITAKVNVPKCKVKIIA